MEVFERHRRGIRINGWLFHAEIVNWDIINNMRKGLTMLQVIWIIMAAV